MNFTWLNKQGVESDSGFIVQFTGRYTAEYRENGKALTLEIDGEMSEVCFRKDQFLKWSSCAKEQKTAINNFKEGCIFQGLKPVAI